MDSVITAAALALARGDAFTSLNWVALRNDPPALALRGVALARLGDLDLARSLLAKAKRGFGAKQAVARARCTLAEAEIALVSRDLGWSAASLESVEEVLRQRGDLLNADYTRQLQARHLLLRGRLEQAQTLLARIAVADFPPALAVAHELTLAGIAIRKLDIWAAKNALVRAREASARAQIPELEAEVQSTAQLLTQPAARRILNGSSVLLTLAQVQALFTRPLLVIDACRMRVRAQDRVVSLGSRPVLFKLVRTLAEAWPREVPRAELIAQVFRLRQVDETHRARLRVEVGRLRRALAPLASIAATPGGYRIQPTTTAELALLTLPAEVKYPEVLALLADGEAWSSSALALVLETSQRSVQRALDTLQNEGRVRSNGQGRSRRWQVDPLPGFTPTLLLPAFLPND